MVKIDLYVLFYDDTCVFFARAAAVEIGGDKQVKSSKRAHAYLPK
jgi:hypothetical protein